MAEFFKLENFRRNRRKIEVARKAEVFDLGPLLEESSGNRKGTDKLDAFGLNHLFNHEMDVVAESSRTAKYRLQLILHVNGRVIALVRADASKLAVIVHFKNERLVHNGGIIICI